MVGKSEGSSSNKKWGYSMQVTTAKMRRLLARVFHHQLNAYPVDENFRSKLLKNYMILLNQLTGDQLKKLYVEVGYVMKEVTSNEGY